MTENYELKSARGEWGLIVEIEKNLWRIRLKNPYSSLMINTYVYHNIDTFAVFDPGWPWTLEQLERAFLAVKLGNISDVTHWIYTHSHIDHMGAAALLGQQSTAPHYASKTLENKFENWHAFVDHANYWVPWAEEAFVEQHVINIFRDSQANTLAKRRTMLQLFGPGSIKNAQTILPGETLEVGDLNFEILDVKGHDPTHLAFYEKEKKWLISGDVILSTPTPISRAMEDSIDDYHQSLNCLLSFDVEMLLPGHGVHKKKNYLRSVERSLGHLSQYQEFVLNALQHTQDPLSLLDICLQFDPDLLQRNQGYASVQMALIDSHIQKQIRIGNANKIEGPKYLSS